MYSSLFFVQKDLLVSARLEMKMLFLYQPCYTLKSLRNRSTYIMWSLDLQMFGCLLSWIWWWLVIFWSKNCGEKKNKTKQENQQKIRRDIPESWFMLKDFEHKAFYGFLLFLLSKFTFLSGKVLKNTVDPIYMCYDPRTLSWKTITVNCPANEINFVVVEFRHSGNYYQRSSLWKNGNQSSPKKKWICSIWNYH